MFHRSVSEPALRRQMSSVNICRHSDHEKQSYDKHSRTQGVCASFLPLCVRVCDNVRTRANNQKHRPPARPVCRAEATGAYCIRRKGNKKPDEWSSVSLSNSPIINPLALRINMSRAEPSAIGFTIPCSSARLDLTASIFTSRCPVSITRSCPATGWTSRQRRFAIALRRRANASRCALRGRVIPRTRMRQRPGASAPSMQQ